VTQVWWLLSHPSGQPSIHPSISQMHAGVYYNQILAALTHSGSLSWEKLMISALNFLIEVIDPNLA